jgi:uncharacterized phage-like protein YoqJ
MFTIAFTGHRPEKLGGYDLKNERNAKIINNLGNIVFEKLKELYKTNSEIKVMTGGALGIDQMAFEICYFLKTKCFEDLKLEIAIPFKNQSKVWNEQSKTFYESQKSRADIITFVDELECYKIPDNIVGEYDRIKLLKRNEYMVDNCNLLIAVWDGSKSGTSSCINYAKIVKRDVFIIDLISIK